MFFQSNKIILLGKNGMLGQMVNHFFRKNGFEVIEIDERYEYGDKNGLIQKIKKENEGWIVNCIGKIKQKTENPSDLFLSNTLLPIELIHLINEYDRYFLIQPSTDCVFDGKDTKPYTTKDFTNAKDYYGRSKILAEVALEGNKNSLIIRTSIIGPDKSNNAKGLLAWFLSTHQQELQGYTNHYWNGLTTLEWCKQLSNIINSFYQNEKNLLQLGSQKIYTKYEMLVLFNSFFKLDKKILPFKAEHTINRALVPNIECPNLEEMLSELVDYPFYK